MDGSTPWLFAHRGSSLLAPENTAAAFDLAHQYQADVLEIDVRLSRDGRLMVIHDETVDRTTDGHGKVRDFSVSALKALDASCRFRDLNNTAWNRPAERLMTLDELFDRYPSIGINIDIKDNSPEAAQAVATSLKNRSSNTWTNVGSFWPETLSYFRRISPEHPTSAGKKEVAQLYFGRWLGSNQYITKVDTNQPPNTLDSVSEELGNNSISLPYSNLQIPPRYAGLPLSSKRFIEHAAKHQLKVVYWTINSEKQMRRILNNGAHGIVTDRLDIARKLLDSIPVC